MLSQEQLRKNEEALHDAQVEMEQDDLVSVGSVAQPLGSPMRPLSMMATNPLVEVQDTKVGLHDFELLSVVGQGAFGKVRGSWPPAWMAFAASLADAPAHQLLQFLTTAGVPGPL